MYIHIIFDVDDIVLNFEEKKRWFLFRTIIMLDYEKK